MWFSNKKILQKKIKIMKKKILGCVTIAAIATVGVLNVNFSSKTDGMLSDIALANVEALAQDEVVLSDYEWGCIDDCVNPHGQKGVKYYCKSGSGGCYNSECVHGMC